jgi:hypothetical protein
MDGRKNVESSTGASVVLSLCLDMVVCVSGAGVERSVCSQRLRRVRRAEQRCAADEEKGGGDDSTE